MTEAEIAGLAANMVADPSGRATRLPRPLPDLDPATGYALQHAVTALREQRGEAVVGYKVGCASPTIRRQLNVPGPIFGRVYDTDWYPSGVRLPARLSADLTVEGELAVRLGADLPDHSLPEAGYDKAVGSVFVVIELHDAPPRARPLSQAELIAANGIHLGVVQGPEVSWAPGAKGPTSLAVHLDGSEVGSTPHPWAFGSAAGALAWLHEQLRRVGIPLTKGQAVLTGSVLPLFPVASPGGSPSGSRAVRITSPPLPPCSASAGS